MNGDDKWIDEGPDLTCPLCSEPVVKTYAGFSAYDQLFDPSVHSRLEKARQNGQFAERAEALQAVLHETVHGEAASSWLSIEERLQQLNSDYFDAIDGPAYEARRAEERAQGAAQSARDRRARAQEAAEAARRRRRIRGLATVGSIVVAAIVIAVDYSPTVDTNVAARTTASQTTQSSTTPATSPSTAAPASSSPAATRSAMTDEIQALSDTEARRLVGNLSDLAIDNAVDGTQPTLDSSGCRALQVVSADTARSSVLRDFAQATRDLWC